MRKLTRIKTVGIVFSVIAIICLVGIVFSSKGTLKKREGLIESGSLELRGRGSRMYSITTFQLEGSSEKFIVSERGDANSFTDRVTIGDTVKLYKKTILQIFSGTFVGGNTFRVEKNGVVLYDDISGLRNTGWPLFGIFGLVALMGIWLYRIEAKKWYRKTK